MFLRYLKHAVAAVALSAASMSASAVPACNQGADVLTLGTCEYGGLVFGDWSVNVAGGSAAVFFSTGSSVNDHWVNVQFQLTGATGGGGGTNPNPSGMDILLQYSVYALTGSMTGIDIAIGTAAGFVTIVEDAYSAANHTGSLAELIVVNGGTESGIAYFDPQPIIYLNKDIAIGSPGAIGSISDFTNSHHFVPEPATLALLGLGLAGLGIGASRRRRT